MTGGALALLAFETAVIVGVFPESSARSYALGAMHVAILATLTMVLGASFLAHDRAAILHMRGAWGEENTRDELDRAQRKRLIWGWVDSVTVQQGDIDHLVVTRTGGLVAIDSKWRNVTGESDREAMARDAQKVRLRAEGVMRTVLRTERGAHRDRAKGHSVTPLLVVWGAAQHAIPSGASIDGIEVVAGRKLLEWLSAHTSDVVDEPSAHDLLLRLNKFRETAWDSVHGSPGMGKPT